MEIRLQWWHWVQIWKPLILDNAVWIHSNPRTVDGVHCLIYSGNWFDKNPKVTWKSPLSSKFSAISRPYSTFRYWGSLASFQTLLVARVRTFQSLVLQVGGLTCCWQQHSVKTFLLRRLSDSWAGQNPVRGCSADWRRRRSRRIDLRVLFFLVI